ncbi:MAG: hypothetical protein NVSMB26_23210 [Beijerinckiaceae bacterium]
MEALEIVWGYFMGRLQDFSTVLDAYHQLEKGRKLSKLKAAEEKLRAFDPANEILPELNEKIRSFSDHQATSILRILPLTPGA